MTVISISLIESSAQLVAGIPSTISISANIPSTVFYTIDGSTPTTNSPIYIGPIKLPSNLLSITLNIFATNGVDTSSIISETYVTNILDNIRLPHSTTNQVPGSNIQSLFPFGTNTSQPNATFVSPGEAGITVNDPSLPATGTGFGADGSPTALTNQPYNLENYSIVYTTTNAEGERGSGIGNLPADVTIKTEDAPPNESQQFSNMFNPRAMVIFQDVSKENPEDPPNINRMNFTLENSERVRDGGMYYTTGLDAPPVNGTFLRSYYNPRTNENTYYYYDSWNNRWIISTAPHNPTATFDGNMAGMKTARGGAGGKITLTREE